MTQQIQVTPHQVLELLHAAKELNTYIAEIVADEGNLRKSIHLLETLLYFFRQHPDESAEAGELLEARKQFSEMGTKLLSALKDEAYFNAEIARVERLVSSEETLLEHAKKDVKKTIENFKEELKFIKGLEAYTTAEVRAHDDLNKHLIGDEGFVTHVQTFIANTSLIFDSAKVTLTADLNAAKNDLTKLKTLCRKQQRATRQQIDDEQKIINVKQELVDALNELGRQSHRTTGVVFGTVTELLAQINQVDDGLHIQIKSNLQLDREIFDAVGKIEQNVDALKAEVDSLKDASALNTFHSRNQTYFDSLLKQLTEALAANVSLLRSEVNDVQKISDFLKQLDGELTEFEKTL